METKSLMDIICLKIILWDLFPHHFLKNSFFINFDFKVFYFLFP